jgi:hypothetical protein
VPAPAAPKGELDFLADGFNNSAQQPQDGFGEPAAFGADGAAGMMQQPGEPGVICTAGASGFEMSLCWCNVITVHAAAAGMY